MGMLETISFCFIVGMVAAVPTWIVTEDIRKALAVLFLWPIVVLIYAGKGIMAMAKDL